MTFVVAYAAAVAAFLTIDAIWLSIAMPRFYRKKLAHLLAEKAKVEIALAFYAIYVLGVLVFAVAPGLSAGDWLVAAGFGALFGFFAYATYELTNFSTLRDWPMSLLIVDVAWGALLTGASATIGFFAARAYAA